MKKNYNVTILSICLFVLSIPFGYSQSTEDFETEAAGSTTFTDSGSTFTISSSTGEAYNIFNNGYNDAGTIDNCAGCGWNGTSSDNKFIDNTGHLNGNNNGSSFTITSTSEFVTKSLYLFCSTNTITAHTGSVTITGKRGGITQYSISKSSGFANPTTFTPNNGFTFIDFATEGAANYSNTIIDELVFTSTGNLDYMALDGFTWLLGTLSEQHFNPTDNNVIIYPNPSSEYINFSKLDSDENYTIYNLLGKKIEEGKINPSKQINIQNLESGIYYIHLKNGTTHKFIKE